MYANRFADGPRFRPASLGVALAINGGVIAALLLASPELIPGVKRDPIKTIFIAAPEPPPPPPPKAKPTETTPTQARPSTGTPTDTPERPTTAETPLVGGINLYPPGNPGTGTGPIIVDPPIDPPIPPAFVAARQDPRYLGQFQPDYPDFERDAGREDVVRLRVLIGVDGCVKQVERLGGRDSFVRASTAHALAKWRFTPATRGGVPEESWMVMTVRFTLDE